MKKIVYFIGAVLVAGFASCSKDDLTETTPVEGRTIEICGTASQLVTRAAVDGKTATWNTGDSFRLYDDLYEHNTDWKMTFGECDGEVSAAFTGSIASGVAREKFYAVHPYKEGSVTTDLTAYPIAVPDKQSVANSQDSRGYGKYLVEVAYAEYPGDPSGRNPVVLNFSHVTAIWDITIANAAGKSIKTVYLVADNGVKPFVTEATIDLTKNYKLDPMTIVPTAWSSGISSSFEAPESGSSVKARIFMLPTNTEAAGVGTDLNIVVGFSDGSTYTFVRPGVKKKFVNGTVYNSVVDLARPDIDDSDFIIEDGVVTGYKGAGGDIVLPAAATSINESVFKGNLNITSVNLKNVTSVGYLAFKGCNALTSVNAPNLETIGNEGFSSCSLLETVISPKLKTIGGASFQNCAKLNAIDLSQVTKITMLGATGSNQNVFAGTGLVNVEMPMLEGFLPMKTFANCKSLISGKFPKVTSVGDPGSAANQEVFSNSTVESLFFDAAKELSTRSLVSCSSLKSLYTPQVKTLGKEALYACENLESLSFPEVIVIDKVGIFFKNLKLKSLDMPKLEKILQPFSGNSKPAAQCPELKELNFPALMIVGDNVFKDLPNLEKVTFPSLVSLGAGAFKVVQDNLTPAYKLTIDLSGAANLDAVAADAVPDMATITIRVATEALKAKFPGTKYTVGL